MGIGAIDTTSELSLHMLGMHGTAYANYAVEDCDFLFAVGSRFDDRVAGKVKEFAPHAKIAHLDVDASEIGKVKNVDWAHVSDAKRGLQQLLDGRRRASRRTSAAGASTCRRSSSGTRSTTTASSNLIQSEYVLAQLNEITRGDAIVTTGVGQHQMWAAQYLDFIHPRTFLTSGSMGTMGFGLPAAIGAQIANPGKLVIDVDGDGSIRMNLGELETLTTYDIPVKVLLLNNLGDGMVRQWQDLFYANRYSGSDKTLHKKDFVKAVEADGFEFAKRVTAIDDVRPTARRVRQLLRAGVPRGHGRPERPRLPDGRAGHGLQGHDHRQVHPEPRPDTEGNRGAGRLLLRPAAAALRAASFLRPAPRPHSRGFRRTCWARCGLPRSTAGAAGWAPPTICHTVDPPGSRRRPPSRTGRLFDLFRCRPEPIARIIREVAFDDGAELGGVGGARDGVAEGADAGRALQVAAGELAHEDRPPRIAVAFDHGGVMREQQGLLVGVTSVAPESARRAARR